MNSTTTKRPRSAKPFRSRIATSGPVNKLINDKELTWNKICSDVRLINKNVLILN